MLIGLATLALGYHQDGQSQSGGNLSKSTTITSIPFGETNGNGVYNASGVIQLADSRFLFCDNNTSDALFELNLTADGLKKDQLIRRPLQGLAIDAVDDLEAMTVAEKEGRRFIFVTTSLSLKKPKDGQAPRVAPSGLLRVTVNADGSLSAENLPGFRDWFIQHVPAIAASVTRVPDEGGLNIEGLAWDQEREALLFTVRTPVVANRPLVIPVRLKDLAGPWTTDNLKMMPPIHLLLDAAVDAQGIRGIEYVASRHAFLVIVGKAISGSKAPFALYEWKGGKRGRARRLDVSFAEKMKPEGVTDGTIAGKPVLLFVDDGGGYQVVPPDTLRPVAKIDQKRAK